MLLPLIKEVQFFKNNKIREEDLSFIWKKLKFKFVEENQNVITFGDYGNEFFW